MSEFLGLQSLNQGIFLDQNERELRATEQEARLKRHALLFDRIGLFDLFKWQEPGPEWTNSINWLIEQQVLFKVSNEIRPEFLRIAPPELRTYASELFKWQGDEQYRNIKKEIRQSQRRLEKASKDLDKLKNELEAELSSGRRLAIAKRLSEIRENVQGSRAFFNNEDRKIEKIDSLILRMYAMQMETLDKVSAIPLLSSGDYAYEIPTSSKNNVIEITIKKFPLPSATTPWEAILDYRNDEDTRKSLRALRNWIRNISSKQLPVNEVEDELESLMDEFQNHMKLHKLKADSETLQTLVKAPLNVIEGLIHLQPMKMLDPLFVFQKRRISLMEAELNAPGKEVAYLIKTKQSFE